MTEYIIGSLGFGAVFMIVLLLAGMCMRGLK